MHPGWLPVSCAVFVLACGRPRPATADADATGSARPIDAGPGETGAGPEGIDAGPGGTGAGPEGIDAGPGSRRSATVDLLQRSLLGSRRVADTVQSLTDEVGPRLAGSPGDAHAVEWAVRAMKERGLFHVRAETVSVPAWERGTETAAIVAPVAQKLAVTALGWSGATPAGGIEAEVVRFESLDALRNADESAVAGRIVFLDVPTVRSRDGHGYGAAVPVRRNGPVEAARKKAAAIVIRSIGTDRSRFPHTGASEREPGQQASEAIPAGALSNADADLLGRILASRGRARIALNLRPKWRGDAVSANVVGEIPGGERRAEIVLLGAHLDSWDLGTGAVDDGAGCGIVLEAARSIGALPLKPARTVRLVLFAAEENSLAGAQTYAKAHAAEIAMHVVAFEADSGTDRVFALQYLGAQEARPRFRALAMALAPLGIAASDENAHGGADVYPLRMLGVPVIDLEQDMTGYFDVHHTANDTFAQIDPDALAQASSAFATAAWVAATMDDDFGRIAESDRN